MYWCISLIWIWCRLRTEPREHQCSVPPPSQRETRAERWTLGFVPYWKHDSYWKCYLRYTDCWSNLGLSSSLLPSSSWWNLSFVSQRCFLFCDQVMPRFWLLSWACELCLSVQSGCSAFLSNHSSTGRIPFCLLAQEACAPIIWSLAHSCLFAWLGQHMQAISASLASWKAFFSNSAVLE